MHALSRLENGTESLCANTHTHGGYTRFNSCNISGLYANILPNSQLPSNPPGVRLLTHDVTHPPSTPTGIRGVNHGFSKRRVYKYPMSLLGHTVPTCGRAHSPPCQLISLFFLLFFLSANPIPAPSGQKIWKEHAQTGRGGKVLSLACSCCDPRCASFLFGHDFLKDRQLSPTR